jgi:hypothetical protein
MKVKNLCQNQSAEMCARMALDLHDLKIEWVNDGPADLLIWDAYTNYEQVKEYPADLKLCMDLQHASADKHRGWSNVGWLAHEPFQNNYAVIECEDPGYQNNKILFYDFLWNRSKAYYTQRHWTQVERPWYMINQDDFLLQNISSADAKTRLFLSPNKLGRPNSPYRTRLTEVVQRYDIEPLGFISVVTPGGDSRNLLSNSVQPGAWRVAQIIHNNRTGAPYGYVPVHNAYYNETFFSVYVETFETGTTQFITEKTLDPLIKGHFILPFSSPGFVRYIKSRGWQLPEFIDYSYDLINDDDLRFAAFKREFERLCLFDMDKWRQLWVDNIGILEYNRNRLHTRPYDRLEILNAKV